MHEQFYEINKLYIVELFQITFHESVQRSPTSVPIPVTGIENMTVCNKAFSTNFDLVISFFNLSFILQAN